MNTEQSQNLSSGDRKQPNVYLWIWYPPKHRTPKRTKHSNFFSLFSLFPIFLFPSSFLLFFPLFLSFTFLSLQSQMMPCSTTFWVVFIYSRVRISNGRHYTILMHISPPFKQTSFVLETYISELPNTCSTSSKFVLNEPTCPASPFAQKHTNMRR
jgi:hypothetical protein